MMNKVKKKFCDKPLRNYKKYNLEEYHRNLEDFLVIKALILNVFKNHI